jgi:hypothetical protein
MSKSKNSIKEIHRWNKTKKIYLDWIEDNQLKKIFSKKLVIDGLSLWWVNSLTLKENMIDKGWYCDLNNRINFNKNIQKKNFFKFGVIFYLKFLKNFITMIIWSIFIRLISKSRKSQKNIKYIFHSYNYNFFKEKYFLDRCYGNALENFKKNNLSLISVIKKRNFISNYKNLKKINNSYLICDEFIEIKDILIVYFKIFKKYLLIKQILDTKKNLFYMNNRNCENVLKYKLLLSFSGEIQNSIINALAVKKSIEGINPKVFITYAKLSIARPMYFFINKHFSNLKIINYQHGHSTRNILFDNHKDKEFSKSKKSFGLKFSPSPDIYLTQGLQYSSVLKSFFKGQVHTIGCLKYDNKKFKTNIKKKNKFKTILICPSIGDEDDILEYLNKTKYVDCRLILSPHPTYKTEVIKKYKKVLKNKFTVEVYNNISTFDLINKSDLVICGFSSVAFEATILGKKSLRVLNLKNPIYNEYEDGIPFVTNQEEFDRILNNINLIKLDKKEIKKNKLYYFYKMDNCASKRFWKIVKNINETTKKI